MSRLVEERDFTKIEVVNKVLPFVEGYL